MTTRWIPTSAAIYGAIRAQHHANMRVFGTITDTGDYNGGPHIMTEWGLPGADYPLIKSDEKSGVVTYWIAVVTKDEE